MNALSRPQVWRWALTLGGLALAVIILFDLSPWVRGGYGWRWEYDPLPRVPWGLLACVGGYIGLSLWLIRTHARARWMILLAGIAAALIPILAASTRGDSVYPLFSRIFSEVASHHMVGAASVDWAGGEWRDWPEVMGRIGSHVGTSPPGLLLAYGLVTDIADKTGLATPLSRPLVAALCADYKLYDLTPAEIASGWLGVLYPVWAALAVIPLYHLARAIGGTRPVLAVSCWPLVPALSGFAASNSTLFPIFSLLMALALVGRQTNWRAAVAGVVFGLAIFTNFALLPLAGFAGFFVLGRWFITQPRPPLSRPVLLGVAFGLGALVPWGVWWLLTGDTPLDILRQSLGYHLELERPYWFWVWFHVVDWALWGGLMFVIAALVTGRHWWRERIQNPDGAALGLALALTVLTLTVSGITRGESGRIWLFLVPFALVLLSRQMSGWWLHLVVTQGVLTLALIIAVDAFNAPDVPALPRLSTPSDVAPLATFSENGVAAFEIRGAQAESDGDRLTLTLEVVGRTPPLTPAWFGMALVSPDGAVIASEPVQPVSVETGEPLPATCWATEQSATIRLSDDLDVPIPMGDGYYISVSVYDYRSNGAVWTVNGGADTQLGLGPFQLGNP